MGKHSRKTDLSPADAQKIADAAQALTPAEQRSAIAAYFEGAHQARDTGSSGKHQKEG